MLLFDLIDLIFDTIKLTCDLIMLIVDLVNVTPLQVAGYDVTPNMTPLLPTGSEHMDAGNQKSVSCPLRSQMNSLTTIVQWRIPLRGS